MTDVFISYSRKDKDFVKLLHAALKEQGRDAWIDWQDIPFTVDWWQEIAAGIEAANSFVFIISPDSVASKVCGQEVEHAVKYGKRLIPVVWRDGFDIKQMHPALSKLNWLPFRENDDFDKAFQLLIKAIDTDLEHVQLHTYLLTRAIEWHKKNEDSSYLLRASALAEAEKWLAQSAQKEPNSTALHRDYISASLMSETASDLYRTLFLSLNKIVGVLTVIRRSKRNTFPRLIEWSLYLLAASSICLLLFDFNYVPLRDFWLLGKVKLPLLPTITLPMPPAPAECKPLGANPDKATLITACYDHVKGIEAYPDTEAYLDTVNKLEQQIQQNGVQSAATAQTLKSLQEQSKRMISQDWFTVANKSGTLGKIEDRMRDRIYVEKATIAASLVSTDPAQRLAFEEATRKKAKQSSQKAFNLFWSSNYLDQAGVQKELEWFDTHIRALMQTNYYRSIDENGELTNKFWLPNTPFMVLFTIELIARTWYLSKKLNISFGKALGTRWYDFFWLTAVVSWSWLHWLYLIPFAIRTYQVGILGQILRINSRIFQTVEPLPEPVKNNRLQGGENEP